MKHRCLLAAGALLLAGTVAAQGLLPRTGAGPWAERLGERRSTAVAALHLSPSQQQAYAELRALRLANLATARAELSALSERVKADLSDPSADLRATQQAIRVTADALIAAHRDYTSARLDFYQQELDPTQQAQVRAHLLAAVERLERLGELLLAFAHSTE
jgi:hypothetical protein